MPIDAETPFGVNGRQPECWCVEEIAWTCITRATTRFVSNVIESLQK